MDQKSKSTLLNGILKVLGSVSDAAIRAGAASQPRREGLAKKNCGKCPATGAKLTPTSEAKAAPAVGSRRV